LPPLGFRSSRNTLTLTLTEHRARFYSWRLPAHHDSGHDSGRRSPAPSTDTGRRPPSGLSRPPAPRCTRPRPRPAFESTRRTRSLLRLFPHRPAVQAQATPSMSLFCVPRRQDASCSCSVAQAGPFVYADSRRTPLGLFSQLRGSPCCDHGAARDFKHVPIKRRRRRRAGAHAPQGEGAYRVCHPEPHPLPCSCPLATYVPSTPLLPCSLPSVQSGLSCAHRRQGWGLPSRF
jgi:hypothetical protein